MILENIDTEQTLKQIEIVVKYLSFSGTPFYPYTALHVIFHVKFEQTLNTEHIGIVVRYFSSSGIAFSYTTCLFSFVKRYVKYGWKLKEDSL